MGRVGGGRIPPMMPDPGGTGARAERHVEGMTLGEDRQPDGNDRHRLNDRRYLSGIHPI